MSTALALVGFAGITSAIGGAIAPFVPIAVVSYVAKEILQTGSDLASATAEISQAQELAAIVARLESLDQGFRIFGLATESDSMLHLLANPEIKISLAGYGYSSIAQVEV